MDTFFAKGDPSSSKYLGSNGTTVKGKTTSGSFPCGGGRMGMTFSDRVGRPFPEDESLPVPISYIWYSIRNILVPVVSVP